MMVGEGVKGLLGPGGERWRGRKSARTAASQFHYQDNAWTPWATCPLHLKALPALAHRTAFFSSAILCLSSSLFLVSPVHPLLSTLSPSLLAELLPRALPLFYAFVIPYPRLLFFSLSLSLSLLTHSPLHHVCRRRPQARRPARGRSRRGHACYGRGDPSCQCPSGGHPG